VREIFVEVERDNRPGKAFYQSKGFRYMREFTVELPHQSLVLEEYALPISAEMGAG
jgi:ribosomal protein S18 acetylase RimI-like enzyme